MSDPDRDNARRAQRALLWIVTIIGGMGMTAAGITKFTAPEMWGGLFTEWGYSVGFKNLIGGLEIAAGLGVLIPRLATYAGMLGCVIMLGAIYTVAVNQSDLGFVANTGNLILFGIITWARRGDRWIPAH